MDKHREHECVIPVKLQGCPRHGTSRRRLLTLFASANSTPITDNGDRHVLELHFVKKIQSSLPLQTLLQGRHGGIVGNNARLATGSFDFTKQLKSLMPHLALGQGRDCRRVRYKTK